MRLFRTLPTRRLAVVLGLAVMLGVGAGTLAVTASGGGGSPPPPKPLAQALHDALAAPRPAGITARVTFVNRLFPSGALFGQSGSALLSGASGRLWATNDGRGRIELQSDAGDVQIVWNADRLTVYDASSNTLYEAKLPAKAGAPDTADNGAPPSVEQITSWLTKLGEHALISAADPTTLAGQQAYAVAVSPKDTSSLIGSAELAWDAATGAPLHLALTAKGATAPVLELTANEISYGAVASSDVDVAPPSTAKIVELGGGTSASDTGGTPPPAVTGVDAVGAAVSFPLVAPDSIAGRARTSVRLVGQGDAKGALLVYGSGLGSLAVVERPAGSGASASKQLGVLPKVTIGAATGHELETPLGTVLTFDNAGVSFIVAGSVTAADLEAAAKELG